MIIVVVLLITTVRLSSLPLPPRVYKLLLLDYFRTTVSRRLTRAALSYLYTRPPNDYRCTLAARWNSKETPSRFRTANITCSPVYRLHVTAKRIAVVAVRVGVLAVVALRLNCAIFYVPGAHSRPGRWSDNNDRCCSNDERGGPSDGI